MRTTEQQIAQIFDRKSNFIEQIKQQTLQFEQLLGSKLLIRGISPPSWLCIPLFPSNPNGHLIPHSLPAISCSSSHFPFGNANHQDVNAHHSEVPNDSFAEFRASNVGLDAGEEPLVLPQSVGYASDAVNPVPEQDISVVSPHQPKDGENSGIIQAQAQSLVKIQRSKSRQKALAKRNSVKKDKSCLRNENHPISTAIRGSGIALLQSDHPNVSELLQEVENNNERSSVEEQTDDCGSKYRNDSFSFGLVTRSKSSGHQSGSIKEEFCGRNSNGVAHNPEPTFPEFVGSSVQTPNCINHVVELPIHSSLSIKNSGGEDKKRVKSREKESSVSRRLSGLGNFGSEPNIVLDSVLNSGRKEETAKFAQVPNTVNKIDELVRSSMSSVDELLSGGRDGRANLTSTDKLPDVITTVGGSSCQSGLRKRSMQQQDSASAGTSNEKTRNVYCSRHEGSSIPSQQTSTVEETKNEDSLPSVVNEIGSRLEHVGVLLERNSRKRSMQQKESANSGTSNEKSGYFNFSTHKRIIISGQQSSVEENKHEGGSLSAAKGTDSKFEHVDVLLEPLISPVFDKNCMRQQENANAGTSNENSGNVYCCRHEGSSIPVQQISSVEETKNEGSSPSVVNEIDSRVEHVSVHLERNSRKRSMQQKESANSGTSNEKSGNFNSSRHKRFTISGQQPSSVEENKHEGGSLSAANETDSKFEHVNVLLEPLISPVSDKNCSAEEERIENPGSKDRGFNISYRLPRSDSSILLSDLVGQSTNQYAELQKSFGGEKEYFLSKERDAKHSSRSMESSSSGHKCSYVGTDGNPIIENDSIGIYFQAIGKLNQVSSNVCIELPNPSPHLSESHQVEETIIGDCGSMKKESDASCSIMRARKSRLSCNTVNISSKRGSFSKTGKEDLVGEFIEEPENVGKLKELMEEKLDNCLSKGNGSSLYSGRMTRSRNSSKQSRSFKATLDMGTSYLANGSDQTIGSSANESIKASIKVNKSPYQLHLSPPSSDNSGLRELDVGDCKVNEKESSTSTSVTKFGISADGLRKSLQNLNYFDDVNKKIEGKVNQSWSKNSSSNTSIGRMTSSRTSSKQTAFAKETSEDDKECLNNSREIVLGSSLEDNMIFDIMKASTDEKVDRRKDNEIVSPCIRTASGSSSLQPDHVNDIVKSAGRINHNKQDVGCNYLGETNFVTKINKLAGDSCSPTDMLVLEDKDESTNPLAPIPTGVVTGNYDIMPVFESFVMDAHDREHVSEDRICLENLDIPDTALSRASLLEQLCNTVCLHTPMSHDPTTLRMHEGQYLDQPVADELYGAAGSRSSSSLNECGGQHTRVDFSYLKDVGTSCSYSLPRSSLESSQNDKKPCTSPVKKVWDSILSISGSSGKKRSLILDLPCIREENENIDAVADTFQEVIDSDALIKSARKEPLTDITEDILEVLNLARSSMDSVNIDGNFNGTSKKVKRNFTNQSGRGSTKVRDYQTTSLAAKQAAGLLNGRPSKTEELGKMSLRGGYSYSKKGSKSTNLVCNINSFIPLVQQKQATGVVAGKRDIKVKALEAAEAAKRLAEKKENERKLRKEALKLERVKQEKENLRQLELNLKKKEDERKKKDAEMAARKRQREEEERKEKERRRKRLKEGKKHLRGHEEKLGGEKSYKEQKSVNVDEIAHHSSDVRNGAGNARMAEEELGDQKGDLSSNEDPLTLGGLDGVGSQSMVDNHLEVISNAHVAENIENEVTVKEQSYDMSPYQPSDDEEDEDVPNRKFIPSWASKSSLSMAIFSQQYVDPDVIFPSGSFC